MKFGDDDSQNSRCLVTFSNQRNFILGSFRFSDEAKCPEHFRKPPIKSEWIYQCSKPVIRKTSAFVFSPDALAEVVLNLLGMKSDNLDITDPANQSLEFRRTKLPSVECHPAGLIVIAGSTGTGKSAYARAIVLRWLIAVAMLEYGALSVKQKPKFSPPHLVSFEDPIEGWKCYRWKKNERLDDLPEYDLNKAPESDLELGIRLTCRSKHFDVASLRMAHIEALRQKPRVIYIGECRERKDWERAIELGGTGHLVVTTCHSSTLVDTFMKLAGDGNRSAQSRQQLASTLRGVLHLRTGEFQPPMGTKFDPIQTHFHLWRNTSESVSNFVMDGLSSIVSDGVNVFSRRALAEKTIALQKSGCFDANSNITLYKQLLKPILDSAFQLDLRGT